jgi:hypothetical protein
LLSTAAGIDPEETPLMLTCQNPNNSPHDHGLQRTRRERRVFIVTLGFCAVLAFGLFVWTYGSVYIAYWNYSPQDGDILFQSLPPSRLVNAIEGVSQSPYSHCGIVTKQNGRWVICEAFRNVELTPLKEFVFRGRNQGFAVYRLKADFQKFIPATIENARKYLGRPYDVQYQMDDARIYCSELIYKGYREASGQQLGKLVRLGDLNWRPFEEAIKYFEGGPVPLDREMITPKDMAEASQLELVFVHKMAVEPVESRR